jgi:hypothetical protein
MILSSHGLIASQIASFDADAVAFFGRVTTAGGTLSTTEKQAVNQLVLDLKANSLWTPMKAIYPMVGASAAACAQNLKSASFTGTFTSGWTFASTGVTPNGTSAYMNTGYNVNTEGSLNSAHISVYIRNNVATGSQIGAYVGGSFHHLYGRYTDTKAYIAVNSIESSLSSTNSQGFWIGSRIISTVQKLYRNNTTFINATSVSTSKPNLNIYVGASNGSLVDYSSTQNAFASIGDGLDDTQASNFYTAVQAFQTTLSRQV